MPCVYFMGSCSLIPYSWSVFTANTHAEKIEETISIKKQKEISQRWLKRVQSFHTLFKSTYCIFSARKVTLTFKLQGCSIQLQSGNMTLKDMLRDLLLQYMYFRCASWQLNLPMLTTLYGCVLIFHSWCFFSPFFC